MTNYIAGPLTHEQKLQFESLRTDENVALLSSQISVDGMDVSVATVVQLFEDTGGMVYLVPTALLLTNELMEVLNLVSCDGEPTSTF